MCLVCVCLNRWVRTHTCAKHHPHSFILLNTHSRFSHNCLYQENMCLLYGVCRCINLKVTSVSAVYLVYYCYYYLMPWHSLLYCVHSCSPYGKKILHNPNTAMQFHSYEQSMTSWYLNQANHCMFVLCIAYVCKRYVAVPTCHGTSK